MKKKKRNYGEKVLTMTQFLNYYFNSGCGEEEFKNDQLSMFYSTLDFTHREFDHYLYDLKVELQVLERRKKLEDIIIEANSLSNEFFSLMEKNISGKEKNELYKLLEIKKETLEDEIFKLQNKEDLYFLCNNFRRMPNDAVKQEDVLSGRSILVVDKNHNPAYYINPDRIILENNCSMYDLEEFYGSKEEIEKERVKILLRRGNRHDKY